MDYSKERNSNNVEVRDPAQTEQPQAAKESKPGFGNKKLDGPNRPST